MNRFGLALDIDGVFLKGSTVLKCAANAIKLIKDNKTPFIFITNGGGTSERDKARQLSEKLGTEIHTSQILLSHSPYRKHVDTYRNSRVLVVGSEKCLEVAKEYGFQKAASIEDIHRENKDIYPWRKPLAQQASSASSSSNEPISAAFIFHDPLDWAVEMQVLTDCILGGSPLGQGNEQKIPLFACNSDLTFKTTYHRPRYTQGAFLQAFRTLFHSYTGNFPKIDMCGKPFSVQYNYAEHMIRKEAKRIGNSIVPELFIGVGDNPDADIRGANYAGNHWRSVLVKTGIHESDENDKENPADLFCNDVEEAMQALYRSSSKSPNEEGFLDLLLSDSDLISALSENNSEEQR